MAASTARSDIQFCARRLPSFPRRTGVNLMFSLSKTRPPTSRRAIMSWQSLEVLVGGLTPAGEDRNGAEGLFPRRRGRRCRCREHRRSPPPSTVIVCSDAALRQPCRKCIPVAILSAPPAQQVPAHRTEPRATRPVKQPSGSFPKSKVWPGRFHPGFRTPQSQ